MRSRTLTLLALSLPLAGLMLAACDESEQGRIIRYEKGTYLGEPDAPLTPEQIDTLRHRATLQGAN